ncbi:uncharacterized protein LOC131252809 [Magnolia sinica]|uniref:uncharacterized protein LOC131252809 n=1 Tax=Magnolia sinica TaxID=86752 RepID=UPI002659439E|nr:uncharacterized protein LOC131252809 [Magnolia sinica]
MSKTFKYVDFHLSERREMSQSRENGSDFWKPYMFLAEKTSDFIWRWLKTVIGLLLLTSFLFVFYLAFSNQSQWKCPKCPYVLPEIPCSSPPEHQPSITRPDGQPNISHDGQTNISHIVFGIGGSVETWPKRRRYSELWWKPGQTRGFVWLDKKPHDGDTWPAVSIPYRVSEDTGRIGRRSAERIARIVAESVRLEMEHVRWYVMGDDDTVFFTENLVEVLGKYDHEEYRYVGGVSESVEQAVMHSYGMAFGGGGFAISSSLARVLARAMDGCLERYAHFYGSDQRVHACLSELGVPLTREPGFHQVDLRGDAYGLLAAHPVAPLVSLHHLNYVKPLIPSGSQFDALEAILRASRLDPSRSLQQTFCYDTRRNWSVSISWGYTAQIYPWILTANMLEMPLRTFKTWRSYRDEPFTFNTRPWSPDTCENPLLYFLDRVDALGRGVTRSVYSRYRADPKECERAGFEPAQKIKSVEVFASKMGPGEWSKAPRRHCCDVQSNDGRESDSIEVKIRKCHVGDSPSLQ